MKSLSLFLNFTLISVALAQQPQAQPPAQPASSEQSAKPATLEGRILNAKTGEPVRKANVTLRRSGVSGAGGGTIGSISASGPPAAPYAATTDAQGKFHINNVEPATYHLTVERQGFVRQEYGSRNRSRMGTPITLNPGQEMNAIELKLTPQAVITGRVLDEDGDPLSRVTIQVLRRRFMAGKQQLMPTGGNQTNDNGEFRISDLPPGRYFLSASYHRMMFNGEAPARHAAGTPEEEYVTTYYPGTTDQTGAGPLDLQAGQELPGVDIRMKKAPVYRIRGKIVAAPGQSVRNLRLIVMPRTASPAMSAFMGGSNALMKEDGSFETGGVQSGSYQLAIAPMQGMQTVMGKTPVEVGKGDVEGITVALGSGVNLTGSIRIDAPSDELDQFQSQGGKLTFETVRVQLAPADGIAFNTPRSTTKDDGTFSIDNVSQDRYRINAVNLPSGTWLKSIRAGDQEVQDTGLDLNSGNVGPIQITLGLGGSQIDGVVQDAQQHPASGSMVTLIRDPVIAERFDLNRLTTTDQNGRFSLKGIPPGEYKVYAWEDIEPGAYTDPEFLKPHEGKATKLSLKNKGQEQVSLVQIPAEASEPK
jgi:5-hydroxyisourate hydrolase-like protein (transthyretin family)